MPMRRTQGQATSRLLLIDVSNSFTKVAVAGNGRIGRVRRIPTSSLAKEDFSCLKADLAVVASVVPRVNSLISSALPCPPLWVDHRVPGGVTVSYPEPTTIGADRLANAAAAVSLGAVPSIVVDFGTAVTFDVIDGRGRYCGGVIAPGIPTAAAALHERTALLPLAMVRSITRPVGRSTGEAIRIGLLLGAVGLVRETVARITSVQFRGRKPTVLATGGDAALVDRLCRSGGRVFDRVDPLLTLRGLLAIAERSL